MPNWPQLLRRGNHSTHGLTPASFGGCHFLTPQAGGASEAYAQYKRVGGQRLSPLPDFYIGAHAEVEGLTLVTRDVSRYRTYFPSVSLITP